MATLPSVPRRFVTTQTPRSRVSGADIAAGGRAAGDALQQVGAGVLELERAVRNRQATGLSLEIENDLQKARLENIGNPEAFKAYAVKYGRDLQKNNPNLSREISEMVAIRGSDGKPVLGTVASRHYDSLNTQLHNATFDNTKKSMVARLDQIDELMAAKAHENEFDDEWKLLNAEKEDIYDELARQPLYGVPADQIDAIRSRSEGRLIAEGIVGAATRHKKDSAPQPASVVDRIISAESGGDPTAQAAGSTATGLGQFTEGTWLDVLQRYRPDLANGRSREEQLALRTDPALSKQMTAAFASQNTEVLARAGHPATARNVYLAHFLGAGGAVAVLNAAPGDSVGDALAAGGVGNADAMIAANPSILSGKTVGEVAAWAAGKMGESDDVASLLETALWDPALDLSPEDRRRFIGYGVTEANRQDAENKKISAEAAEGWERQIIDGAAEITPLLPRSEIEDDPTLTEGARNTLLRQYDAAAESVNVSASAYQRFTQGGSFSAFDTDDRKSIDKIWKKLGGDGPALKTVVDQTGIVPPTVVKGMRGDLVSTDPERLGSALQLANNLIAANPNAFAGHDGASDIETSAYTFRHYVDRLGYTADEATMRIAQENTPEYKADVAAKVKGEDIAQVARDNLSVSDLEQAFDPNTFWFGLPDIGFSPEARQGMFSDYSELFRHRYAERGDVSKAKSLAQDQLKRTWGVSRVNESDVVVRYPPEMVPGMEQIENPSELIALDAIESIAGQYDATVPRDKLRISPIPGQTANAYKTGRPVPYMLSWEDDDGIVHSLNPGKAFAVDPGSLRARQTEMREKAFRDAQPTIEKRGVLGELPTEIPTRTPPQPEPPTPIEDRGVPVGVP